MVIPSLLCFYTRCGEKKVKEEGQYPPRMLFYSVFKNVQPLQRGHIRFCGFTLDAHYHLTLLYHPSLKTRDDDDPSLKT